MELNLEQLKEIANKVGLGYHHNVGETKLKLALEEHTAEIGTTIDEVAIELGFNKQSEIQTLELDLANGTSKKVPNVEHEGLVFKNDKGEIIDISSLTFSAIETNKARKTEITRLKEANKLIRCIITTNNKNKSAYQGEIFTVRNMLLPEITKMVPFGVPTHIPQIMYNMIREKQYQIFYEAKLPNGLKTKKTRLVPEYNIEILPPLTKTELEAIRQKQLAENSSGE